MRIAYLIPEFPSQTHAFFWREIKQLELLGATVDLVSTRRPSSAATAPHSWATQAIARTTYLYPMSARQTSSAVWQLFKAGPSAWWRYAGMISPSPRLAARMLGLMTIGARLTALGRQRDWTHLHVHSCADAANIALFAHLCSTLPYSLTLHGDLHTYGGNQANKWRHARFGVVTTDASMAATTSEMAGYLPPLVLKAPMGVRLETFTRNSPYQPHDGTGPLRIFSCGRLHPVKGIDVLIQSLTQARKQGLHVELNGPTTTVREPGGSPVSMAPSLTSPHANSSMASASAWSASSANRIAARTNSWRPWPTNSAIRSHRSATVWRSCEWRRSMRRSSKFEP